MRWVLDPPHKRPRMLNAGKVLLSARSTGDGHHIPDPQHVL